MEAIEARNIIKNMHIKCATDEQEKAMRMVYDCLEGIELGDTVYIVSDDSVIIKARITSVHRWWNDYQGYQGEYEYHVDGEFGTGSFNGNDRGNKVFLDYSKALSSIQIN